MTLLLPPIEPDEQYPVWDYTVSLDDDEFRIRLTYRERQDRWYLDLWDASGNELVKGKRLSIDWPVLDGHEIDGLPDGMLILLDTSGGGTEASDVAGGCDGEAGEPLFDAAFLPFPWLEAPSRFPMVGRPLVALDHL